MHFTDLDRQFWPVDKNDEFDNSHNVYWGNPFGGGFDWKYILSHKRVILLAEASSGKTEEFTNKNRELLGKGKISFFVRIEDLCDDEIEGCLDHESINLFQNWKIGHEHAFFFLDSVDEARLNRKSFERALRKFTRSIAPNLDRCSVYISSRMTDWRGVDDYRLVESYLQIREQQQKAEPPDPISALLDPIFEKNNKNDNNQTESEIQTANDLIVVRLAPLSEDQQGKLAAAKGLSDVSSFQTAIWKNGLETFAERPGDLIELAAYWLEFNAFGSLAEMTDHAIGLKLTELDPYRPDNTQLSNEKARQGAERIAAALTLGKTFTLKSPAQEPDPDLAVGALDPTKLLPDWNEAERNALLRRGIFSPATYGRIRFHHRATQEYLTAQWIDRLLANGCSLTNVFKLLFTELYRVRLVVHSMKPVAAWLALSHDSVREEVLSRDPIILIQHGDPGSLAIETRKKLLRAFSDKHLAGDIADDNIDYRSLWMFAHTELADTIREVWNSNTLYDFRSTLIRLVREGGIVDCADLVEKVALEENANDYQRTAAVQALIACKKKSTVSKIADQILQDPENLNAKIAAYLAKELFPDFLNVDQLITLIRRTSAPTSGSTEGFGYALKDLWSKCPDKWREKFLTEITNLALSKPFVSEYQRVSNQFRFLAKHCQSIGREAILELGEAIPSHGIVRLLMVIERVEYSHSVLDDDETLRVLIQDRTNIQRALFWADVEEIRRNKSEDEAPIRFQEIYFRNAPLWQFSADDLPWLYEDLADRIHISDKRIALSAIVKILVEENKFDEQRADLVGHLKAEPILVKDLKEYIAPPEETEWQRDYRISQQVRLDEQYIHDETNKNSWRQFREELISDPKQIESPEKRLSRIHDLTKWLRNRTNQGFEKAPLHWRLLEEAFSKEVAEAFARAMKSHWRSTKPERPRRSGQSGVTVKWTTIYAYAGIGVEAGMNKNWAANLPESEAETAMKHGCFSEQGYPDWIEDLVAAQPNLALPVLKKQFRSEWKSAKNGPSELLYRYSNSNFFLLPAISVQLFDVMMRSDARLLQRLDRGISILHRIEKSSSESRRLMRIAIQRFEHYVANLKPSFALRYLALLFGVDPQEALSRLKIWLESLEPKESAGLALKIFGVMFNQGDDGLIANSLKTAKVETLRDLIVMAYSNIRPADDIVHDGVFAPNSRDHAESGRGALLSTLIHRGDYTAYATMKELAQHPAIGDRSHRFHELARKMVERDAEISSWTEHETYKFEAVYIVPVKTGHDLLLAVLNTLHDVQHDFDCQDASSKRLLGALGKIDQDDEESVQNWLAEQLRLRSNDRYHVYREVEVADKNEPDIVLSAATALSEIAIEVKQADSCSLHKLEASLRRQLAEDYLKPETRRHGVLVITDHGRKGWRHPTTNRRMSFQQLVKWLQDVAQSTTANSAGNIEVSVFGLDAKPQ